jgi:hypothetical protein
MIVVSAADRVARAADMPVVKAQPVDYVERCTQYGNGWIRYPGTAYCIKLAAKATFDVDTAGRQDVLVLQQNQGGTNTHYLQTFVRRDQQDDFGYGTNVSFGAMTRTQTAFGTLASSAQFGFGQTSGLDGGNAKTPASALGPGDGVTFKNSNTIFGGNISFSWGPLGNIAMGRFTSEYVYMGQGDFANNGYGIPSLRSNHLYYQWNSSGSNNDPVGWTLQIAAEDPAAHSDGGQWGPKERGLDGCVSVTSPHDTSCVPTGTDNAIHANGFGSVAVTRGPFRMPDIVPNVRWLDDEIGSFFTAFALHSIDRQVQAGTLLSSAFGLNTNCNGPGVSAGIAVGGCTNGAAFHSIGWGNLYALNLNLPKTPGYAPFARDYILTEVTFSNGAMQEGGFHPSKHVRCGSPPFTNCGLLIDDSDAVAIALPGGGLFLEKERFAVWNFEYKHYLTSCTDPDWCWNYHANSSLGWIRPGPIARNTDWTKGGVGNYFGQAYEFGLHYGVAELNMEVEADITYWHATQDVAHDPGVAPTPLPQSINPNGGNWIFSINFSRNFGGALGKNLAGF